MAVSLILDTMQKAETSRKVGGKGQLLESEPTPRDAVYSAYTIPRTVPFILGFFKKLLTQIHVTWACVSDTVEEELGLWL